MLHVLSGVLELLRRERPLVPVREALALLERDPEQLVDEQLVARLVRRGRQRCGDLRVEHVGRSHSPGALEQEEILPAGVHHDLDAGIGEQRQQRTRIVVAERVDRADQRPAVGALDGDLDQAEQGEVPALPT